MVRYILFSYLIFCVACNNSSENKFQEEQKNLITTIEAEQLYKTNCASCHKLNENDIGPMLKAVAQRWQSKELLYEFIRNSQEVSTRNVYAKKLLEDYKQYPMTAFPNLKDEEIEAILKYCDSN